MPTGTVVTRRELLERRSELLRQAGLPEDELRHRAAAYLLDLQQIAVIDELDEIAYLLSR
jgi:hypothetical protein